MRRRREPAGCALALAWLLTACHGFAPGLLQRGEPHAADAAAASDRFAPEPGWATGSVFHDLDGDGVRGAREPGLAGVAVSNGRDVVRTDAAGRYRLRVDDDTILFVVKPSGWRTPALARAPAALSLHPQAGGLRAGSALSGRRSDGRAAGLGRFSAHAADGVRRASA